MEAFTRKEICVATCKHCGAETQLYSSNVPICPACANDLEAKSALTSDIPNDVQLSLPHE